MNIYCLTAIYFWIFFAYVVWLSVKVKINLSRHLLCPVQCKEGSEEPLLCISLEVPRLKTAPTAHRHRPALQPNLRLNTVPTTHSSIREVYKVRSSPTPIPPSNTQVYNVHIQIFFSFLLHCLGTFSWENEWVLLYFVQMRGGRALPKFFGTF